MASTGSVFDFQILHAVDQEAAQSTVYGLGRALDVFGGVVVDLVEVACLPQDATDGAAGEEYLQVLALDEQVGRNGPFEAVATVGSTDKKGRPHPHGGEEPSLLKRQSFQRVTHARAS
jgi:hypothetical protein